MMKLKQLISRNSWKKSRIMVNSEPHHTPTAHVPTRALNPNTVDYTSTTKQMPSARQTPTRRAPTNTHENSQKLPPELLQCIFCLLLEYQPRRIMPDDPIFASDSHLLFNRRMVETSNPSSTLNPLADVTNRCHVLQPTLARAARVCLAWSCLVEPLLYRAIVIDRAEALDNLLQTLRTREELRELVESVLYIPPPVSRPDGDWFRVGVQVTMLYEVSDLCLHISIYHLDYRMPRHREGWSFTHYCSIRITTPIPSDFIRSLATSLTRLEITNPAAKMLYSDTFFLGEEFPVLEDLVLSECELPIWFTPYHDTATGELKAHERAAVWPFLPSLRQFVLHDCVIPQYYSFPSSLSSLRVFEVIGGKIDAVISFLGTLNDAAPDLEVLTMVPEKVRNEYSPSRPLFSVVVFTTFETFKALVHIRFAVRMFILTLSFPLPIRVRHLHIIDEGRASKHERSLTAKVLDEMLDVKVIYQDLEYIRITAIQEEFYRDCVKLSAKGDRGVEIDVRFKGAVGFIYI